MNRRKLIYYIYEFSTFFASKI